MSQLLREVFPQITIKEGKEDLFSRIEVKELAYNDTKTILYVYLILDRLFDKETLREIQNSIQKAHFPGGIPKVKIEETYQFAVPYTMGNLLDTYYPNMIEDISESNTLVRCLFADASYKIISDQEIHFTLKENLIARSRKEEFEKTLRNIFKTRFSMDVKFQIDFSASDKPHTYHHVVNPVKEPETVDASEIKEENSTDNSENKVAKDEEITLNNSKTEAKSNITNKDSDPDNTDKNSKSDNTNKNSKSDNTNSDSKSNNTNKNSKSNNTNNDSKPDNSNKETASDKIENKTESSEPLHVTPIESPETMSDEEKRKAEAFRNILIKTSPKKPPVYKTPDLIFGKAFTDPVTSIDSLEYNEEGPLTISGEVITFQVKELRNKDKYIVTFNLYDGTGAISCKVFVTPEELAGLTKEMKPRLDLDKSDDYNPLNSGSFVKVKGTALMDDFQHEVVLQRIIGIYRSAPFVMHKGEDLQVEKRVELHCHTNMSENDAISSVEKLLDTASRFGHKSIAITDHGCVYAFPEAYSLTTGKGKYKDIKVIFGIEGYLVDDSQNPVQREQGQNVFDTAVVFDLETTGFSADYDRIIEIGAVKIQNGHVIDRFSTFVNPEIPIPFRIEELTHINDNMVKDADTIDKVLPRFLEFIEGAYLVAHNQSFDVTFIKQNIKKVLVKDAPVFTTVDTVGLARHCYPSLGNYKLDHIAKELKISLSNHHRAVDDAEATAMIYLALLKKLKVNEDMSLKELSEKTVLTDEAICRLHSHHIILLVKNEVGRKNLYRLISESEVRFLSRAGKNSRPLMPKSLVEKYREGLIIGSACSEGEVYEAILRGFTQDEMYSLIRFYDYLEIQPIANNFYLIRTGEYNQVKTEEDLKAINRQIVKLGEENNKPVVATCDVHFAEPEDKIYREILQFKEGYKDYMFQAPLYYRTTDEMLTEFEYLGSEKAREVVIQNPKNISDSIEKLSPFYMNPDNPEKQFGAYPIIDNADNDLRSVCYNTAISIYGDPLPKVVSDRLEKELTAIIKNGYASLYMIAKKLVAKSTEDGYIVGSRGSVGSSFVATMAGITEVNPLPAHYVCPNCHYSDFHPIFKPGEESLSGCDLPDLICPKCKTLMKKDGFNIPFETFMGIKGDKTPDIDLNFSSEYQNKAHAFTEVIFGEGQTYRAGTISAIKLKTAIGYVKDYFSEKGIPKTGADITQLALGLVSVRRTTGQHPGGIVVVPQGKDIRDFTPIQYPSHDSEKMITTSFEYHSIESNLLKLDILGHENPTVLRMIRDLTGTDPFLYPLTDQAVIDLWKGTEPLGILPEDIHGTKMGVLGLPEFGTDFAMSIVDSCKPKTFTDLVRITGMSHGTNVWQNNNQLLFAENVVTLNSAICCRDDIMLYLMQMGLASADAFAIMEDVRKGRHLKKEEETLMREYHVEDSYIWSCNKIEYMFPKAHAVAYVMMAVRLGYAKIYHPLAYYASYFSIRSEEKFNYEKMAFGIDKVRACMTEYTSKPHHTDTEKAEYDVLRIVEEMYARGFSFAPIELDTVEATRFRIVDEKRLMPSLITIQGIGPKDANSITYDREANPRKYTSLENFKNRTGVSTNGLEKLAELHILEGLPKNDQLNLFQFI